MTNDFIPIVDLKSQHDSLISQINEKIAEIISTSSFIRSKDITQFENGINNLIGSNYCVSVANGTDALYILLKGFNLKPGDEVITTAHSWISTAEVISQAGGNVVFCDTSILDFNIDAAKIESLITPKTVGIIPVHLYGHPVNIEQLNKIKEKYNLWIIEDCAQAINAKYKEKQVGSLFDAAIFSFYPGKNLGAMGDAGCITTNDHKLAEWCRLYANHGGKGIHAFEGINSRMDGIQAAILNIKLPFLDEWTCNRQKLASIYNQELSSLGDIVTPFKANHVDHVYHLYTIKTSYRDELSEYLRARNIATSINYPISLPFLPAFKRLGHQHKDFPNAFQNQREILSLPMFPELTENQLHRIIDTITQFFTN